MHPLPDFPKRPAYLSYGALWISLFFSILFCFYKKLTASISWLHKKWILVLVYFWDCILIHFPLPTLSPPKYLSHPSFKFMTSFFIYCYSMHVYIYLYILFIFPSLWLNNVCPYILYLSEDTLGPVFIFWRVPYNEAISFRVCHIESTWAWWLHERCQM